MRGPIPALRLLPLAVLILSPAAEPAWPAEPTPAPATSPALPPPVPVLTAFSYWDHHWIQWLPTHPVYEAIEVLTIDAPRPSGERLWRVFLTERTGGRRQVHYFNEAAVAQKWPTEAYHRPIEARLEGAPGGPRGLSLKFRDKADQPVEWTVAFTPEDVLGAEVEGMAPHTHGVESVFLIFHRGRRALAPASRLTINGEDFSPKAGVSLPGRSSQAAYTSGVFIATLTYGTAEFIATAEGFSSSSPRREFRLDSSSAEGRQYRSTPTGTVELSHIEIDTTAAGALRSYRHRLAIHTFRIDFEPPLPGLTAAIPEAGVRFAIALDQYERLLSGTLVPRREGEGVAIDWSWASPEWAKVHPVVSRLRPTGPNRYVLELARAAASPAPDLPKILPGALE